MAQAPKEGYTQGHHESVTRAHNVRTVEDSAAFLLPHLRPDMKILDIGCGPGSITRGFGKHVPQGSVLGVEISESVLEQARFNTRDLSNLSFQLGNVIDGIALPDGSFDVVYCHQVLIHLVDHVSALKEMKRLCRPNGGMVACREGDFGTLVQFPSNRGLELYLEGYVKMIRKAGMEPLAGRHLHSWARQAGFDSENITKTASVTLLSRPEEREFYAAMNRDRFTQSDLRVKFKDAGLTDAELDEIVQGFQTWKDDPDGWYSIMQGEILCRT